MFKLIPPIMACLAIGFGLGSIPGLNEHLHWNLWFVIPISGLIIGALCGWVCFKICFNLNVNLRFLTIAILGTAAAVGYIAVDYGTYRSITVSMEGDENIPDGEYKLSSAMTFIQYMKFNLQSTSISTKPGKEAFEMGSSAAKISFGADLLGAFLGAIAVLMINAGISPFCDDCSRYKTKYKNQEIVFQNTEENSSTIFEKIGKLITEGDYHNINGNFEELSETYSANEGNIKTTIDQRYCSDCGSVTISGRVYQHDTKDWNEIDELAFAFNSDPGVFELVEKETS